MSQGTKAFFSLSCLHIEVQAVHHIYMAGSTYVKGKGDIGVSSASMATLLMSSRTHRRTVFMDSYTLLPSSDLFSICSKANKTLNLLKQNQWHGNELNCWNESQIIRRVGFLTQVKALIVRFRNAFSTSSGIVSIWAIQSSMHVNVSLGAWEEMKMVKLKRKLGTWLWYCCCFKCESAQRTRWPGQVCWGPFEHQCCGGSGLWLPEWRWPAL